MKYRNGFVANSSTSSFIAVGWYIGDSADALKEFLEKNNIPIEITTNSLYQTVSDLEKSDIFKIEIENAEYPIIHRTGCDYTDIVIGVELSESEIISDARIKMSQQVISEIQDRFPTIAEKEPNLMTLVWDDR